MLSDERHAALVADIRDNGLRVPIVIQDGMILDGRNRYKACQELGIHPETTEYTGNPWAYVWSLNGTRRDLTDAQRAAIWLKIDAQSREYMDRDAARRAQIEQERRAKIAARMQGNDNASMIKTDVVHEEQHLFHADRAKSRAAAAAEAHVHPFFRLRNLRNPPVYPVLGPLSCTWCTVVYPLCTLPCSKIPL